MPVQSSSSSKNLVVKQEVSDHHHASSTKQQQQGAQLLRDLELLKQRRKALENEIQARDLAVFDLETSYLEMTASPLPIKQLDAPSSSQQITNSTSATISSNNNNNAGSIRTRDGKKVMNNTKDDNDDKTTNNKSNNKPSWFDHQQPKVDNHISAVRLGDCSADVVLQSSSSSVTNNNNSNVVSGSNYVKTVQTSERMFSLTNFGALANCAKFGVVDQN